jgi:hypothetical protein
VHGAARDLDPVLPRLVLSVEPRQRARPPPGRG